MAPGDEWLCPGSVPVTRIPNPQEPHAQLSQQPRSRPGGDKAAPKCWQTLSPLLAGAAAGVVSRNC